MSATATHPTQAEPVFSSRQDETPERGQCLTVTCYFPDGSHDSETERLGDYGNWIPAEEITDAEERLTRKLRRRIQSKSSDPNSNPKQP